MNRKKRKTALILLLAILCAIVLLGIRGTRKTIDDLHALLHHHFRHAQENMVFH